MAVLLIYLRLRETWKTSGSYFVLFTKNVRDTKVRMMRRVGHQLKIHEGQRPREVCGNIKLHGSYKNDTRDKDWAPLAEDWGLMANCYEHGKSIAIFAQGNGFLNHFSDYKFFEKSALCY
jgi:hypothetical protein